MRENSHVRFGGRPRGKGPEPRTPRRAAHPTQIGKGQVGLDHYQCRTWTAWHRFTVLAMAALAILVAITATQPPSPAGLAPLTVPETRRLLTALTSTTTDPHTTIRWSLWRRHHIATAHASHYKRRMIIESEHVNR